jgi:hypothetical protein
MASVEIIVADPEEPDDLDKGKSLGWFDVDELAESSVTISDFYGGTTKILGPNSTKVVLRTSGLTPGKAPKAEKAEEESAKAESKK